jgi:dienelactone hydrolase
MRAIAAASLAILLVCSRAPSQTPTPSAAATRSSFLAMIDRPRVPLAPSLRALSDSAGAAREHVTFAAEAGERVALLVVKPEPGRGRRPAVIVLHGTGGKKEDQARLLHMLADAGFVAIAMDARYHGERAREVPGPSTPYVNAMLETYRSGKGHPFLYDTVWDVMRLVDYLQTRPDVDGSRIGLMGISKGGMETYLAAAVDPRIAAAAPVIGVQSFHWALDHDSWQSRVSTFQGAVDAVARETGGAVDSALVRRFYDRVAPGVYGRYDAPAMLPLIAPRPLIAINGGSDPRTPAAGVRESAAAAERAYAAAGAPERFHLMLQPGVAHQQTAAGDQAAVQWFVRWLGPLRAGGGS